MTNQEEFYISWTPWCDGSLPARILDRSFLITSGGVRQARLTPPPCDLPLVWRSNTQACFELPLPVGRGSDPTVQFVDIDLVFGAEQCTRLNLTIGGGVPRFEAGVQTADVDSPREPCTPIEQAGADAQEFISEHVESISEMTFPDRASGRRPARAEGLTVVSTEDFGNLFWMRDTDEAPYRLVVRIAEDCTPMLESICARPRRVLRRQRLLERLDRVQQIDDACLRWFVRQPGRTVLEKAGPRRRVLSVVRTETADTHENRVVRDFLERCRRAADQYLFQNRHRTQSQRLRLVRRFRNRILSWLRYSALAEVPLPVGVPGANYVLQFDDRYRRIWHWYQRLRRQQRYEDEVWRWQHRVWAEHSRLAVLHALERIEGAAPGYRGTIYVRTDPSCGHFVHERSALGCYRAASGRQLLLQAIPRDELCDAAETHPGLSDLVSLGPDTVVIAQGAFSSKTPARVLALWSALRPPGGDWDKAFEEWTASLLRCLPGTFNKEAITPALFTAIPGGQNAEAMPRRVTKWIDGVYAVGFQVPIPVASHLPWLSAQIHDWANEGIL